MSLKGLRDKIASIEVSWDYDETYSNLYNACVEYQNETQDFSVDLDTPFEEIFSYDVVEDIAKHELEKGGLARLYYFMGDVNFGKQDIIRINAYGNCEEISKDDLNMIKDDILKNIDLTLKKEKEQVI